MTAANGKICWVTGASSGIGRAITSQLLDAGHLVYVSGRNSEKLDAIVIEHMDMAGKCIPVPCDVTDDAEMANILGKYEVNLLDEVYLCAGTCEYIDLPFLDIDKIRRVTETNFFGIVNACVAALPVMKNTATMPGRERPHIIGLSSISTYLGFPRAEAYGSSKAAMSYFLHSLRSDLAKAIDVTVVYPGFVETPMTAQNDFPMPFLMPVDKAARIILRKAAKRPLNLAFPTRLHLIVQAMKLFPRLWYSSIASRISRSKEARS